MDYLQELNEAQRKAVTNTEGALLVLAGAGAGKTKTIAHRILHLIKNGIAPSEILAVTFTNKAATEMQERIFSLLEKNNDLNRPISFTDRPFISTFHSLGVFIIKENSKEIGLTKHFSIYDRNDSKKAIRESLVKNGYNPKEFEPGKILAIISKEKGNLINRKEYEVASSNYFSEIVAKVWKNYDEILKNENALDFDDLLTVTAQLLQKEEVRKKYGEKWKYVHIDEYQDTNKAQHTIVGNLVKDHQNICGVGDPDQLIYSWRNASMRNILNFEKDYRGAQIILLEENYRSTKTILAVANEAISKNKFRIEKKLFTKNAIGEKIEVFEGLDETDEAQHVVNKIKELRKREIPLTEIAVLYRANFQSRVLEEACLANNLPYQVLGTKFFERKEIKDILSYLRLAFNSASISDLKRVINTPSRGIGKITLLKIVEKKEEFLPIKTKIKIASFRKILKEIREFALQNPPSKTVTFIAKISGILEDLNSSASKNEEIEKKENIKELTVLASRYEKMSPEEGIEKFLEDAALATDQDSDKEKKEAVRLMTVHASKGLEFSYVFVTGLEEGLFPHNHNDQNLNADESEEERRLFYVAITRTRKKLFLSYAKTRTVFGSCGNNIPSEFLLEIPDEYLEKGFIEF